MPSATEFVIAARSGAGASQVFSFVPNFVSVLRMYNMHPVYAKCNLYVI